MRKYYYYVVKTKRSIVPVVCWSEKGEFPMTGSLKYMKEKLHTNVIITFWKEISETEYNSFIKENRLEEKL